jgi:phosphoribosylformylglycinamidine (FGAM) synthase-like enzyme
MIPPIFTICKNDAGVTALLGSSPVRVYPFGYVDAAVQKPYAVWQLISGSPNHCLGGSIDGNEYTIQVDVYGETDSAVINAASAICTAVTASPVASVANYNGTSRDQETKNYRYSFSVDFIVNN